MMDVDIRVIQRPVSIKFDCPHCEEEICIKYSEFIDIAGDPCDWPYTSIGCPECGGLVKIDNVEWD